KIIVAGTISVALLAGTALAVASNGTQATSDTTEQGDSHWSQMSDYLGDDWSGMVDSMKDVLGDRYGEMEDLMKSTDSNMDWSDMEKFMDGTDMGGYMGGSGMGDFDMGDVEDFMGGSGMGDFDMGDVEDFMGGSGMGGSHMGGTDTGGSMGQSETSGLRSGLNA
ncbi:hypothetical protein MNBD_ACTINO01-1899, partial [hydrothermal vent metagenome]